MRKLNIIRNATLCALLVGTTGAWAFQGGTEQWVSAEAPGATSNTTTAEKKGHLGKMNEQKEPRKDKKPVMTQ